jgi:hypothetical protein
VARGHLDEIAQHAIVLDLQRGDAGLVAVFGFSRHGLARVFRDGAQVIEIGIIALRDEAALRPLGGGVATSARENRSTSARAR